MEKINISEWEELHNNFEDFLEGKKKGTIVLAEPVADILYRCGVRAFWNFSHYDISMKYRDAVTENVHLNDSLMTLCCCMTESRQSNSGE